MDNFTQLYTRWSPEESAKLHQFYRLENIYFQMPSKPDLCLELEKEYNSSLGAQPRKILQLTSLPKDEPEKQSSEELVTARGTKKKEPRQKVARPEQGQAQRRQQTREQCSQTIAKKYQGAATIPPYNKRHLKEMFDKKNRLKQNLQYSRELSQLEDEVGQAEMQRLRRCLERRLTTHDTLLRAYRRDKLGLLLEQLEHSGFKSSEVPPKQDIKDLGY